MSDVVSRLNDKLRAWQMATASREDEKARELANEIYCMVLGEDELLSAIYDERVLLALVQLVDRQPPDAELFGVQIESVRQRAQYVNRVNDLFYSALDPAIEVERLSATLAETLAISEPAASDVCRSLPLGDIRQGLAQPASQRLAIFLEQVASVLAVDSSDVLEGLRSCLDALKEREEVGAANSLLVNRATGEGILLPVKAKVQPGTGRATTVTSAAEDFSNAIERARLAMVSKNFIAGTTDVVVTSGLTDARYSGGSGALATAMAIFSSAKVYQLDPFTAFSGNINLSDNQWTIQAVNGIPAKLTAAAAAGCRRVFLPKDNESDVPQSLPDHLQVVFVDDISQVLSALLLPTAPGPSDTLAGRKVRIVQEMAIEHGWQLSPPKVIDNGEQFVLAPANPPSLRINIYRTGSHAPKTHEAIEFQRVLDRLAELDSGPVQPRSVQQVFEIRSTELRQEIRKALEEVHPSATKEEQYCEYSFRFDADSEKLVVKQYASGKLQLQGYAGQLYKRVLDVIVPRYNLANPGSNLTPEQFLGSGDPITATNEQRASSEGNDSRPGLPYIGTDESGKGDYFGPLVIAAVWLDERTEAMLKELGVRDSKTLSDRKCQELASLIRKICQGKYEEVEISPERYNSLYDEFKRERKNLNHLLAWGHARALESILERNSAESAIADQFGDERYIESKLMERGKRVALLQTPKAERYLAVAAASILARDRFVSRLSQLGAELGVILPKGASPAVVEAATTLADRHGAKVLGRVAKLHFRTTTVVRERATK